MTESEPLPHYETNKILELSCVKNNAHVSTKLDRVWHNVTLNLTKWLGTTHIERVNVERLLKKKLNIGHCCKLYWNSCTHPHAHRCRDVMIQSCCSNLQASIPRVHRSQRLLCTHAIPQTAPHSVRTCVMHHFWAETVPLRSFNVL